MTLQTLQPHIDTSIATKTAVSVLNRVFIEIKDLAKAAEYSEEWLENSLNILRFSNDIEIGFAHSKATMLSIFKEVWDNLPLNFRKQHGYHFINFAKTQTGGKARSTIDAYTRTARLWILNEYGAGKQVEIKQRTPEGRPILNERGAVLTAMAEFCPYNIDLSKLNILNPRAENNDMTDRLWEMLVDPFYTCDDLREEHHKDENGTDGYKYTFCYGLAGPALVATQNGSSVVIAPELNWEEYESDSLVRDAINNILQLLGVEMDEDVIFRMIHEGFK